uniref:Ribonuclease H-like domain-containing protein n=1 Tax=Tanacetum cinerariifolium TaxID=118510 RepID=A0A6L2KS62_TANCI|nr:ribonuclease H-like domain-containing protein [Tanacetum cinerariifolium]
MESLSPQVVAAAKLLVLNPNEFDLWKMRIKQYFLMTDYSLWEVILNGDFPTPTRVVDGVVQPIDPTTVEQRFPKKNKLKAIRTLLMALPDKHQLKFNIHKDAKSLMEAIEKRNKTDIEDQSLNDLFNNLKIYEVEVKSSSSTSHTTQNIAFVCSQNTNSTNESVSAVTSVSAASTKPPASILPNVDNLSDAVSYSFFASQSNSPQLDNDVLKQIDADDLEEMDLKWQMAMLTMRARRFLQQTGRNLGANGTTSIGFDMSNVECYNCHRRGYFSKVCRSPRDTRNKDTQRRNVPLETSTSNALVSQCDGVGLESVEARLVVYQQNENVFEEDIKLLKLDVMLRDNALVELRKKFEKAEKESDELKLKLENFQTSLKNLSKLLERQITDKTRLGYDNQVFNSIVFDCDEMTGSELDVSVPTSPVHDSYKSGEGYHAVPPPYTRTFMPSKPNLVFMMLLLLVRMVQKPVRNHAIRVNHQNFTWMTHPHSKKHVVPTVVLTRSRLVPLNVAKPVTTAVPQTNVNHQRLAKHVVNKPHSPIRRPINHRPSPKTSNFHQKVTIVKPKKVNAVKGTKGNWGNPQQTLKDKGVIDSGGSRHMTGNISYLSEFEAINGGYVAFGGNPKGGKITGKGDLTCIFAKATLDESNLWHRRLGHINFKTMNKLVKEIKKEFSVARTPQQNRIVERKNMTLIEAARTMLTNSLLPISFWAEAVNTACYVQNRVLVTKPHNKTPYELLLGRTPSIGYMRPFGCHVTIINTLDPLGKFNGKADEGFLVGYSVSSKAFRVFNSRTRIVQETLHINFLKNQPNVAGNGPSWLFDIDTLTQSMNYQPVVARNQPNHNAGIQGNFDAGKVVKEAESAQKYVLLPLWSTGSKDPQNTYADLAFDDKENESEVHVSPSSSDKPKKHDERLNEKLKERVIAPVTALGLNSTNSTNSFNAVGPYDTVVNPNFKIGGKSSFVDPSQYPDDPDMSVLEDIVYSDDEEDVGAEADFSNLETSITGHTQEEGIDYEEVFALVARIEAIGLFLAYASFMGFMVYQIDVKSAFLYRTIEEEVYVCQPPGFEDPDYPDKLSRGKIDQTLFIKKQKGDIFLVQVYVDDIIFGSTNKELCKAFEKLMKDKFQMSSMGELTFFLGLQVKQKYNGIFISQDKYVVEILKKFSLTDGKSTSTPIDTEKPLLKDLDGEDVDYAGASLDRKSITGGCQLLGCRLISWKCKKQTVVATSSTEAEYVAAASCCAQVLWIQNQLLDYGNEALAIPGQTTTGKENSNPFMADSLLVTILLTKLAVNLLLFMGYA